MDVKCPVCSETVTSEKVGGLSMALRGHIEEKHELFWSETAKEREVRTFSGTEPEKLSEEARTRIEEVTQFKESRAGETAEERAVATFSGREPYGGPEETKRAVEKVTQFQTPREGETKEECETRTFSETECVVQPDEAQLLKEEVRQWRYPKAGPEGERGPAFLCPVCNVPMAASDEENLNTELKEHFVEVHNLESAKIEMKR